ncbi:hypothetical protein J2Y54_002642 [Sphingomonas sp. BE123]|uniref:hypothetical protein n=1 Tax=Sphingomonas sp. BE123 TaxID=2817842 RepID=UPI00285C26DB|nr:hypothetical protein [Sphingomonas sp. BE123]MDR6853122.1 hypothetical protein [Sphingomonas sp. BE123]
MIAAMALLSLAAAQEPRVLRLHLQGDGDAAPCVVIINGQKVDSSDDRALDEAFAKYPSKEWMVDVFAGEAVAYRCIGGVIYRIQSKGYRFTKTALVQSPVSPK